MGTFLKEGSTGDTGDGWSSGQGSGAPQTRDVTISAKGNEIILTFPDPDIAGPGYYGTGNKSEDAEVSNQGFIISRGVPNLIPSITVDVGSIEIEAEDQESSGTINLIDDESIGLNEIELSGDACPMPRFKLDFETNFDLQQGYADFSSTDEALEQGDATLISNEEDLNESNTISPVDIDFTKKVNEIIDSIVDLDRNIKNESVINVSAGQWVASNQNALTDTVRSQLESAAIGDLGGYFITDTNLADFAELPTFGNPEEEISGFVIDSVDFSSVASIQGSAGGSTAGLSEGITVAVLDMPTYQMYNRLF
jgi:hypothetical protein